MIMGGRTRLPIGRASAKAAAPASASTVKRVRRLMRLSQPRLADLMNLPLSWVRDLEQGRTGFTAASRLLFKTLEMSPEAIAAAAQALRDQDELADTGRK